MQESQTKIPQYSSLSKDSLNVLKSLVTDSFLKKIQFLLVYTTLIRDFLIKKGNFKETYQ